eukprot:2610029-Pleurochrysis_carterae.AAC.1
MLAPVAKRPSARDLLARLPPRLEDEVMKDALQVLSQPHSVHFTTLMEALFAPSRVHLPPLGQGILAKHTLMPPLHSAYFPPLLLLPPQDMLRLHHAATACAAIFLRHGAIE